jgi:hypothetical protein
MKEKILVLLLMLSISALAYAQEYAWTGNAGTTDFFDEANWMDPQTQMSPPSGSIDPFQDINASLYVSCEVEANGTILLGNGSLHIQHGSLSAPRISGGSLMVGQEGYIALSDSLPFDNNPRIDFLSPLGWIKTEAVDPLSFQNDHLARCSVNQVSASYPSSIRLDNYYAAGTVIRANDPDAAPLLLFAQDSMQGSPTEVIIDQVHGGSSIPNGMNNQTRSFLLKKGFMATLAVQEEGTGKSKVFIASESDLAVETMPDVLAAGVSFIRVVPWNWVSKRGTGGDISGLQNTWFYQWSNRGASDLQREYAPMAWGRNGANEQADIDLYKSKYQATHVMGFNEPDHCSGQSGQYFDMCIPDTAVRYYENLMKTGLRLVSPGCRQGAWDDWLKRFNQLAVQRDIRIDVIAVHWYDWGGNPQNTPNTNPQNIFNRFKKYLEDVYELYGLPIWITEFNGNIHRSPGVNLAFMEKALPYLDTLRYVERYAWFQPSTGVADYYDAQGNHTAVGTFYKNQQSTPSLPERVWAGPDNLDASRVGLAYLPECSPYPISSSTEEGLSQAFQKIKLFPNPAADYLHIRGVKDSGQIVVIDMAGKVLPCLVSQGRLDVSHLPKGVYLLRANSQYLKFVKW